MNRAVHQRESLGATARIVQARKLLSCRITVDAPTLVFVRSGQKVLRGSTETVRVEAGSYVAMAAMQVFDVLNTPCPVTGTYEAEWVVWHGDIARRFQLAAPAGRAIASHLLLTRPGASLDESYARARESLIDANGVPEGVARSRLEELLGWLDARGGFFEACKATRTDARVRQLVAGHVSANWTTAEIARRLHMSEATLRRRLADERTGFQAILIDVRMSHALTLLQATDMPVASIAEEVGYQSPSRFAVRFRERFGYAPSDVRLA